MSLFEAVSTCLRMSFDGSGRAARSEFWWWRLFSIVTLAAAGVWSSKAGTPWPVIVTMIVLTPADVGVLVRRLHDTGVTGWLALLAFVPFGPVFLLYLAARRGDPGENRWGPPMPYVPTTEPAPTFF